MSHALPPALYRTIFIWRRNRTNKIYLAAKPYLILSENETLRNVSSDEILLNVTEDEILPMKVPAGSPSRGGDITSFPTPFLFCSYVCLYLYDPFNRILFHKFSLRLSVFSLCSFGLISASLVLSTICLFMKVSFSPDIIHGG